MSEVNKYVRPMNIKILYTILCFANPIEWDTDSTLI